MDNTTRYEIMARAFKAQTGLMAPGKDRPAAGYDADEEKQWRAWAQWKQDHILVIHAMLSGMEQYLNETAGRGGEGMVMEGPRRVHYQVDYPIRFQCGCVVTFIGSCLHRTTRLEACCEHDGLDQFNERSRIVQQSHEQYDLATFNQPPL